MRKTKTLRFMLDLGGGRKVRVTPSFVCTRRGHVWMHLNNAATGNVVAAIGLPARGALTLGAYLQKASFQASGVDTAALETTPRKVRR